MTESVTSPIVVATAADEGYAMPLAVMVRSVLDQLGSSARLRLVILDNGVTEASRERLIASWSDPRLTVDWRRQPAEKTDGLPVDGHATATTYLRLRLPELLDATDRRVIYLDADTLVRRDLSALWSELQGDAPVLAVQDTAAPYLDSEVALDNFPSCHPFLAAVRPIANYRDLGLDPEAPYLNGGMQIVDLDRWRAEGATEKLLTSVRDHREHVLWWDQYALNAVFAGRWRQLDPRWNQGAHVYVYPSWRQSPFGREEFDRVRNDPWIVHFCSPEKPWRYSCRHPFCAEFFETLDRTAWSGWRPSPQPAVDEALRRHRRRLAKTALRQSIRDALGAVRGLWRRAG